MRGIKAFAGACALVLVLPLTAFAQAALSGLVRDTSGAVLPGVTVEAASPVLIEKVRSAVTDSSLLTSSCKASTPIKTPFSSMGAVRKAAGRFPDGA